MKKLNRPLSPTSDSQVRKVYKEIQKGGDVPIGGLGIPYPEKKGTISRDFLLNTLLDLSLYAQSIVKDSLKKYKQTYFVLQDCAMLLP